MDTYELVTTRGQQGIKCLVCKMISYHPMDIQEKYCGNCHQYHPIQFDLADVVIPLPQPIHVIDPVSGAEFDLVREDIVPRRIPRWRRLLEGVRNLLGCAS